MNRHKPISVKIATAKVIKALEVKLAQVKADYTNQSELEAKYQKQLEVWRKSIIKYAFANFATAQNVRTNYRTWEKRLNVDFDLIVDEADFPKEPERSYEQMPSHTYNEMKNELENAIRILKMTDEEVVSTSTYNAIARYL